MKKLSITLCAALAALTALPAFAADAQPTGTIVTANGRATGTLRWKNSAKEYSLTNARGMTVTFPADDVVRVEVNRPAALDAAIKRVRAGGSGVASAIPTLEEIAKDYSHLTYDREATRWLADAYLQQGNASKAVSACEAVIRDDAEAAYMGPMAVLYWRALTKDGKASKLSLLLDKAIASGDERGTARANCEEALRDGYLRVILLYANPESEAYPEALYMGAKAFDGMGQGARANALRDKLKQECASSAWARK